jgi:two-component system sensor histidine kinase CiaH
MWYLALVMAISLMFSVVLYNVTTGELARGLHKETERIYNQYPVFNNSPLLQPNHDIDNSAHRLLLRLIGFNIIVLMGAGFASYWLARRTLEPIEAAHEQQKRFTADVSHELRTPLTALKMESEVALMNKRLGASDLRKTLASNLEEAHKLEALINNLLRLTRLEAAELQQNFTTVQVADLAESAIGQVRKIANSRGVRLKKEAPSVTLSGDPESLAQLLIILLDNAIKYSAKGQTVRLEASANKDTVTFQIIDQGIGIEQRALDRVFDRFYRADNSRTKNDTEGTGLGLSIAQLIADMHHGNITLSSQVGHGTTAIVTVPRTQNSA